MTVAPAPNVNAAALGQLLLMQSVLCGLPDERSIFGFICRGLSFMPGVVSARHVSSDSSEPQRGVRFPLSGATRSWGELEMQLGDADLFSQYEPYVRNFAAMVALILDERAFRKIDQRHSEELETRVRLRTEQLTAQIRERERIEAQLKRSRDMLALTLDSVPQAIFWKNREGRYLGCNRAFAEVAGFSSSEAVIGKTDHDMPWRPDDVRGYRADDAFVLEKGEPRRRVMEQIRRADGSLRWIETTKVPLLDANGVPDAVLGVFEDVTERRQAQEERESLQNQLAQAQKMESVGRLAGGVAHDFNNMLQAILGNAGIALGHPQVTPAIREHLEEIRKAAERSASLTQQLLAFARKQTVTPKVLDLNQVVSNMLRMLKRLISEDVDLQWTPGSSVWSIQVDPVQIDQALANLVVNARDAIRGPGTIRISTANVSLGPERASRLGQVPPGDYVQLTVSDTGVGLSNEAQQHLFEPFFTTKPAGKGTGLGLAMVYGIVKQNHGAIAVQSEPGRGTTFELFFPRSSAMPETGPDEHSAPEPGNGTETLLLVEDEPQILMLAKLILEHHGYQVLATSKPASALEIAQSHPGSIDLLITDVIMPGMNGSALFEKIAQFKPGLRCLFISGYTADILGRDNRAHHDGRFLAKPFTAPELAQRVREVLSSR